ncbi:HXXEE domain-containing protein [Martelella sp. HB161492]|uniref:HXXEE domain-containing protein n=1 Tax=Martelella sp. HB161492 TaxID=2720726 RepID=UPI0032B15F65
MVNWLAKRWVSAALFMAVGFLLLGPAMAVSFAGFFVLIYLHLPIYMFHQVEEHAGDRFRHFTNVTLFRGVEALRPVDVIIVNLPVVWGVNLISFYAALLISPGLGLAAPYLMLVNAILHLVTTIRLRCYNPGLVTAIVLFLPLSLATLLLARQTPGVTIYHHVFALAIAVIIHALIMLQAARRARLLSAGAQG